MRLGFSWGRLAWIEIPAGTIHGDNTLQDYWRRDPGNGSSRTDEQLEAAGQLVRDTGENFGTLSMPRQSCSRKTLSYSKP